MWLDNEIQLWKHKVMNQNKNNPNFILKILSSKLTITILEQDLWVTFSLAKVCI